jgi:sulfhydrogenase subunit gamma (sulfur reductase)
MLITNDIYTPHEAEVIEFTQNKPDIFSLRLRFTDPEIANLYSFRPGQFNMVYLYGVGEVPISIVNDHDSHDAEPGSFKHIIQEVGRQTRGVAKLKTGDKVGVRGPFGTSWPLEDIQGKNIIVVTGGLGNAALIAAVEQIILNYNLYDKLYVLHGIRSSDLLIYESMYERWHNSPNTRVMMATSHADPVDNGKWLWARGLVTDFISKLDVNFNNSVVMTVGPEPMMKAVAKESIATGVNPGNIFLSLERNMKCAIGHCGRCQLREQFICKDGAVYPYSVCAELLEVKGL